MRKSIKLLVACMLCSPVAIVAQEQDSLFARKSKVAIEYGRGISFNLKESTTATAVASEEELSHKKSINNSNMLYGLIPGLQVLQNSDNAWNDAATLRVRGYGTSSSTTPLVLVDGFERSLDQISADGNRVCHCFKRCSFYGSLRNERCQWCYLGENETWKDG